eukprot:TRINITY_DN773110_c0_g1_i1.p1 TRINITY_DN773110_c0_g1~~TRINITY_DN773110_c0_g1_i1.p1  ORF type:complete len:447 (+),score=124.71 TRINITY_DN773110_c0_g1_i1:138-1343(+)
MEDIGFTLKFVSTKSRDYGLHKYGERLVDSVVLFAPNSRSIRTSEIIDFVKSGGNLIVASSTTVSSDIREIVSKCGVDFDDNGSAVIDHFSNFSDDHMDIISSNYIKYGPYLGDFLDESRQVAFRGMGLSFAKNNILIEPVLVGSDFAYSADPGVPLSENKSPLLNAGADVIMAAAVQSRVNGRVLVSGSLDMFGDRLATAAFDNEIFCIRIAEWTFQLRGKLKLENIRHRKVDGSLPEPMLKHPEQHDLPRSAFPDPEVARDSQVYKVMDDLVYQADISEFKDGEWVPFKADDVQLEFVMLDPHVRTTMTHNDEGVFTANFKVPDVYGIFKFHLMYRRPGYSTLEDDRTVVIRPFRHDEFQRFLPAGLPYSISVGCLLMGFFTMVMVYMFHRQPKVGRTE